MAQYRLKYLYSGRYYCAVLLYSHVSLLYKECKSSLKPLHDILLVLLEVNKSREAI